MAVADTVSAFPRAIGDLVAVSRSRATHMPAFVMRASGGFEVDAALLDAPTRPPRGAGFVADAGAAYSKA